MAKMTTKHYARVLYSLVNDTKEIEASVKTFLTFLRERHVLKKADKIMEDYVKYAEDQDGVKRIEITSARKLEKETITIIKKQFGEKVKTVEHIDEKVLGGCIIREKNVVLDGSVRMQVQRLKHNLLKNKITIK